MYERFYGLHTNPFRLTPDSRFFFASGTHNGALAYLRYGILQGEGFVVVTGESGAGKTELARMLLSELQQQDVVIGELAITSLEPDEMLNAIADAFGQERGDDKADTLKRVREFMKACVRDGRRVVLIIDEAQNLPLDSVEELRMLCNLQYREKALFQCILLGTLELRNKCDAARADVLAERVIAAYQLRPLLRTETFEYIQHRLRRAGWIGDPRFTDEACDAVYRHSGGNPRRINLICQRLLLCASLESSHTLDQRIIARVIDELYDEVGGLNEAFGADESKLAAGIAADDSARVGAVGRNPPIFSAAATAPLSATLPRQPARGARGRAWQNRKRSSRPRRIAAGALAVGLLAAVLVEPGQRPTTDTHETRSAIGSDIIIGVLPPATPGAAAQDGARDSTPSAPRAQAVADSDAALFPDSTPSIDDHVEGDAVIIGVVRSGGSPQVPHEPPHDAVTVPAVTARHVDDAPEPRVSPETATADSAAVADPVMNASIAADASRRETSASSPPPRTSSAASAGATNHAPPAPASPPQVTTRAPVAEPAPQHVAMVIPEPPRDAVAPAIVPPLSSDSAIDDPVMTVALTQVAPRDDIPRVALENLVARFTSAYEDGDLAHLSSLLADDVKTNDSAGRRRVAAEYRKLFDVTDARNMVVSGVQWHESGDTLRGEGDFTVTVRPKGRSAQQSYLGRIQLSVERRHDGVVISELHHTYFQ